MCYCLSRWSGITGTMSSCVGPPTSPASWICNQCHATTDSRRHAEITGISKWCGCGHVVHGDGRVCRTVLQWTYSLCSWLGYQFGSISFLGKWLIVAWNVFAIDAGEWKGTTRGGWRKWDGDVESIVCVGNTEYSWNAHFECWDETRIVTCIGG